MHYLGIDPGVSGGVALIHESGDVVDVFKMPDTPKDLLDSLRAVHCPIPGGRRARAVLEKVNPGVFGARKGGQRMGVVSAFTFGKGIGYLEMALLAAGIPYDLVAPATWQKALGCQTGGDKNISKRRAQQLFPTLTITHAIADALLLAEYARRSSAWGIRPGRGATSLPDPGASDGKEENGESIGQFLEEKGARKGRRQAEPGDVAIVDGQVYSAQDLERFQTASERRRAARSSSSAVASAPGNGAGPRRKTRRYLRVVG